MWGQGQGGGWEVAIPALQELTWVEKESNKRLYKMVQRVKVIAKEFCVTGWRSCEPPSDPRVLIIYLQMAK